MIRRSSDSRQLFGGKGNYAPARDPIVCPIVDVASTPCGLWRHPIVFPNVGFCLHALQAFGGKGIRTPDFQLAKLALYQLSYAPALIEEFQIVDCRLRNAKVFIPRNPRFEHSAYQIRARSSGATNIL